MTFRKLPLGVQDFPTLREEGCLYVDKTALLHKLVKEGKAYFLSRPRRFGKSLLCSTLGAYLAGRKDLFAGLALDTLEDAWTKHPVLRLDLNAERYDSPMALEIILESHLRDWESTYGESGERSLAQRFRAVIRRAHQQSGARTVALIDEYDKPLLATLDQPDLHREMKAILKGFYGVLKSADEHLKFLLITGVTKFSQVSVFSDLNHLTDLSMAPDAAALCGITEEELVSVFEPEIKALARKSSMDGDACLAEIRRQYNGYRFHHEGARVFNPFSTLSLFRNLEFRDYWFQTGTPTFLVELLKKCDTDLREIDGIELDARSFGDYRAEADQPLPVIYQSGYLTIKGYNPLYARYTLGYPNAEVRHGFLNFLLPDYTGAERGRGGFHIGKFAEELRAGDVDGFLTRLRSFFENIPYDLNDQTERHYQVVFYLVFTLVGQFIESEVKSANGRADAVVKTEDAIFVFEFKLKGTAAAALKQIDDQGYLIPYEADGRKVVKVGVQFDRKKRNLGRWLVG